jgi:hypothetical protein
MAVMLFVRYPLSLRNVEDLLHERRIDISDETVRFWWNRFGPMFAVEIRRKRVERMRSLQHCRSQRLPDSADRTEDLQYGFAIPAKCNLGASPLPSFNSQARLPHRGRF